MHQTNRDDGLAAVVDRSALANLPPPTLLGAFDPCLLGWASRDQIVGSQQGIVTTNGLFRPFAMVAGRAVATWSLTAGKVTLSPFEAIARADDRALQTDAMAVVEFLG